MFTQMTETSAQSCDKFDSYIVTIIIIVIIIIIIIITTTLF